MRCRKKRGLLAGASVLRRGPSRASDRAANRRALRWTRLERMPLRPRQPKNRIALGEVVKLGVQEFQSDATLVGCLLGLPAVGGRTSARFCKLWTASARVLQLKLCVGLPLTNRRVHAPAGVAGASGLRFRRISADQLLDARIVSAHALFEKPCLSAFLPPCSKELRTYGTNSCKAGRSCSAHVSTNFGGVWQTLKPLQLRLRRAPDQLISFYVEVRGFITNMLNCFAA